MKGCVDREPAKTNKRSYTVVMACNLCLSKQSNHALPGRCLRRVEQPCTASRQDRRRVSCPRCVEWGAIASILAARSDQLGSLIWPHSPTVAETKQPPQQHREEQHTGPLTACARGRRTRFRSQPLFVPGAGSHGYAEAALLTFVPAPATLALPGPQRGVP